MALSKNWRLTGVNAFPVSWKLRMFSILMVSKPFMLSTLVPALWQSNFLKLAYNLSMPRLFADTYLDILHSCEFGIDIRLIEVHVQAC